MRKYEFIDLPLSEPANLQNIPLRIFIVFLLYYRNICTYYKRILLSIGISEILVSRDFNIFFAHINIDATCFDDQLCLSLLTFKNQRIYLFKNFILIIRNSQKFEYKMKVILVLVFCAVACAEKEVDSKKDDLEPAETFFHKKKVIVVPVYYHHYPRYTYSQPYYGYHAQSYYPGYYNGYNSYGSGYGGYGGYRSYRAPSYSYSGYSGYPSYSTSYSSGSSYYDSTIDSSSYDSTIDSDQQYQNDLSYQHHLNEINH